MLHVWLGEPRDMWFWGMPPRAGGGLVLPGTLGTLQNRKLLEDRRFSRHRGVLPKAKRSQSLTEPQMLLWNREFPAIIPLLLILCWFSRTSKPPSWGFQLGLPFIVHICIAHYCTVDHNSVNYLCLQPCMHLAG